MAVTTIEADEAAASMFMFAINKVGQPFHVQIVHLIYFMSELIPTTSYLHQTFVI